MTIEKSKKANKTCFIITPIGEDGSTIRRHINGIIDSAITPILCDNYEITVAHRMPSPGSINKQVIKNIYEADLVIANLTNLNPNVMYELAFRHAIRKPVITIMEKGSGSLPFDVVAERTIFYINDSQGVLDLKNELKEYVEKIEVIDCNEIDNPIYDALQGLTEEKTVLSKIEENNDSEGDALKYIVKRLDDIDRTLYNIVNVSNNSNINKYNMNNEKNTGLLRRIVIDIEDINEIEDSLKNKLIYNILNKIRLNPSIGEIQNITSKDVLKFDCYNLYHIKKSEMIVTNVVKECLRDMGLSHMNFTINMLSYNNRI
ncbi:MULTISPECIES: hypothetical protein [Clostridium]|uniref:hypothetical protein n=1 Tax=Clostridium TaxID=1485 RepID=UPI000773C847|nr:MULTISPECIES: hypothetical protein [Clostridium]AUM96339.1 hypothetical protein RSJ11_14775 [Clostridium sporogenes]AVQ53793.1 hypothetical protein C7M59_13375 [Clostridium botulinum]